jgi:hypothetical protein
MIWTNGAKAPTACPGNRAGTLSGSGICSGSGAQGGYTPLFSGPNTENYYTQFPTHSHLRKPFHYLSGSLAGPLGLFGSLCP